jgi:hypothetical protein
MASHSRESPDVELHEPEIAKPQPLRIIKRSQTVTGSSASREIVGRERGWSGSSDQSKGSPLLGPDRPLTVHKKRNVRGSVLNRSLEEGPLEMLPTSAISELIKKNSGKSLGDLNVMSSLTSSQRGMQLKMILTLPQRRDKLSQGL